MNNQNLEQLSAELDSALRGRRFGRFYSVAPLTFITDLHLPSKLLLAISADPIAPRIHLTNRRLRDVEKAADKSSVFAASLRRLLQGMELLSISKYANDRVLELTGRTLNDDDRESTRTLIVQLTGRSANLFIVNEDRIIIDRLRETTGEGQSIGQAYLPPETGAVRNDRGREVELKVGETVSQALDRLHTAEESRAAIAKKAAEARKSIQRGLKRARTLLENLRCDLGGHGEPEIWKRYGDLLLANPRATGSKDSRVTVTDYFTEGTPAIEIPIDDGDSVSVAAEKYFRKYAKARNARTRIAERLETVAHEIASLEAVIGQIDKAESDADEATIDSFLPKKAAPKPSVKKKERTRFKGARVFKSSDGYDILVGKGSKDNDELTFRVAKSMDMWLHAADYPGSHVVVRNSSRKDVPQKTLIEAAQLAAFYSDAREQPKAAVNYTFKKFVNKPRGAAAGLVSLSSFKTLMVKPEVPDSVTSEKAT